MERVVSATEARARFGELMRRAVEGHEIIVVERRGKPHVVVLSVEEYQRLRKGQHQDEWKELVDQARAQIEAHLGGRTLPPAEETLEQARDARGEELLARR
jgi:prevent-host-death family protein